MNAIGRNILLLLNVILLALALVFSKSVFIFYIEITIFIITYINYSKFMPEYFLNNLSSKILESINEDGWLSLAQGPVEWRIEGPVLILCSQSGGTILLRKNKD